MTRPSIKDVAARAGVSIGTVSNVLNHPALVRPETRARVERAIDKLGFVRNDSARHLRSGSSRTLAYVVLDAANPFFTDVARGIDDVAKDQRLALYLCDSVQDAAREDDYLEQLAEQRVKGICITPVDDANPRLRQLPQMGVPVVLVDRAPSGKAAEWCSVDVDDHAGGELAVTHLLEAGHKSVAFVGGPLTIPQVEQRLAGARHAIKLAGVDEDRLVVRETLALTVAEGRRAGERLIGLPRRRRPTSVFCANDLLALGVLQQMTQQGVRVPDDIAIVGYDDIEFASAAAVPLTSVSQPRNQIGRAAAELVLAEADSPEGHEHRHVQFDPELIVRASSNPAAT
jgi:LacI family transcriptional regulator